MRRLILLVLLLAQQAFGAIPPPPTTPYTRGFLITTNAVEAASYLNLSSGTGSTNFFSTVVITNLYASNFFATNIIVQNVTVSNLYSVNGNHNVLIVTNGITLQAVKTNVLATTSTGLITNVNYGSGLTWTPSTLTLDTASSGGGSSSPWSPVTALTYSTTNVTIPVPTNILTNFLVTLTNSTTYFVAPTGLPASVSTNTTFYLFLQQDSTGVRAVSWAGNFKWPGGVAPVITTNASAIDCIVFTTSPLTATNLFGTWQPNFQ